MTTINVKSVKITIPLKAEELPTDCLPPQGQKIVPIPLTFQCGDITLTATVNGKSYKKALSKVIPGAFAVIQGKLAPGNEILECGLVVQPPKPPKEESGGE